MKISLSLAGCLLTGSLALASTTQVATAQAAPLKFDFGTEQSPVFPGFTRVSDKTLFAPDAAAPDAAAPDAAAPDAAAPDTAFGFVKTAPKGYNQLRPNALAGDFVWSKGKTNFRVNLPNGSYKAWFLYGHSRYGQRVLVPLPKQNTMTVNGQPAVSGEIAGWKEFYTEKYFFRGYSDVYHANDDFYDKYVAPNFKEATAAFEVTNGQALFTLEDIPLAAMIVYPASEAAQVEDDIDYLHSELRRHTIIREVQYDDLNPDPEYSAADKQRGYVVYGNLPSEPPSARERPLPEALNPTPGAFLAAGQKADLSFTILPLQDLQNVKVTVSDLADKTSGAKIAAGDVRLEYIAHREITSDSSRVQSAAYTYRVQPEFIKPFPASFELMDKGINRTILLTVAADGSTRPGTYEGRVTIAPQNAPAREVPVRVRVLPIALPELPIVAGRYAMDHVFYYNYYWSKTFTDDSFRDYVWAMQKKNMQWAKEMGLNSIAWSDDARGDVLSGPMRLDPDGRITRWMDLYRDMGFKAMPWYGFQALTSSSSNMQGLGKERFGPEWTAKYRQLIENIRDTGKERNWPEIIFYLSDELSNHGAEGTEDGLKRAAVTADILGIRRLSSVNGKFEHPLIGKMEILMPNFAFPITQPILDEMQAKNTELWLYNVGDRRFTWGYYPFLTGAKGRFQWFNSTGNCYPFDDFDSGYGDTVYSAFVVGPDGPVSMVNALEMRDGLDDLRYLTLLQQLVENSKAPQSQAAQNARAILAEVRALDVDLRNYAGSNMMDAQAAGFDAGEKLWSPEKCEKMRWRIAEAIMQLQDAAAK